MRPFIFAVAVALCAGCGDKVPESNAAKDLGNIPKQTIDMPLPAPTAPFRRASTG